MTSAEEVSSPDKSFAAQAKDAAQQDCVMLYDSIHKSARETCMCWGWACGEGWFQTLRDASYELEALNIAYGKKHHCHIRADQVKEKMGTLHFYYSIVNDVPVIYEFLSIWLRKLCELINSHFDFKLKQVVVKPAYDEDVVEELDVEQYEAEKKANFTNVECFEFENKFWCVSHYHKYQQTTYVPTQHKIAHHLSKLLSKAAIWLDFSRWWTPSREDDVIREFLSNSAEEIIRKAEDKCYSHCEQCGREIGTNYSPRCSTTGWITYVCESCAKKTGQNYYKGKKLFKNGEQVK